MTNKITAQKAGQILIKRNFELVGKIIESFGDVIVSDFVLETFPFLKNESDILNKYPNISKTFLSYNDKEIEFIHDWVQYIFPLNEPSTYNADAPILSLEDINELQNSKMHQTLILNNLKYFKEFILRSNCLSQARDHNHLRISRAIKSLRLFGLQNQAQDFYNFCLQNRNIKVNNTLIIPASSSEEYWFEALTKQLY